jgi:hypothetical protein
MTLPFCKCVSHSMIEIWQLLLEEGLVKFVWKHENTKFPDASVLRKVIGLQAASSAERWHAR